MPDPQEQQKKNRFEDQFVPETGTPMPAAGGNRFENQFESAPGVTPPKPGLVETANQFYNAPPQPGEGAIARIGRSFGRTAMMPVNLVNSLVNPSKEAPTSTMGERPHEATGAMENIARYNPVQTLIVNPSLQAAEDVQRTADATEARTGKRVSPIARYGGAALASLPVVGPWALQTGKRMQQGDVAGGLTDAATMIALPEVAREVSPGGTVATVVDRATGGRIPGAPVELLPGGPTVNPPAFPTTTRIANTLTRGSAAALERASTPKSIAQIAVATPEIAADVAHGRIPSVGHLTEGGVGGAMAGKAAEVILGPERANTPLLNLPKMRTVGSDNLVTPAEADELNQFAPEQAAEMKVVQPGGKTISMAEYLKNNPQRVVPKTPDQLGLRPVGTQQELPLQPGTTFARPIEGPLFQRPTVTPEELNSVKEVKPETVPQVKGAEAGKVANEFLGQIKPQLEKSLGVTEESVSSHPETAELQKAGMKHADATHVTNVLKKLDNTSDFPQWAMENGYDMGDKLIGRTKAGVSAGTHVTRADVLRDMLQYMSPEEIESSVNEYLMRKK